MARLESQFQAVVVRVLRGSGYHVWKLTGFRGAPDLICLRPGAPGQPAVSFYVELKSRCGVLSAAQKHVCKSLAALTDVLIVRDVAGAGHPLLPPALPYCVSEMGP